MGHARIDGPSPLEPPAPPAYRGSLRIGERVVEKIAARAAREATGSTAPDTKLRDPKAGVKLRNDHATVRLDLDVPYPGHVKDMAGAVRERVRDDVERLTGMPVVRIDVVVARMTRIGKGRRRVQ